MDREEHGGEDERGRVDPRESGSCSLGASTARSKEARTNERGSTPVRTVRHACPLLVSVEVPPPVQDGDATRDRVPVTWRAPERTQVRSVSRPGTLMSA